MSGGGKSGFSRFIRLRLDTRLKAWTVRSDYRAGKLVGLMDMFLRTKRLRLERRVQVLAHRLALAQEHVRVGTIDGRDWERRRDYLIGWLDLASFELYVEVTGRRVATMDLN